VLTTEKSQSGYKHLGNLYAHISNGMLEYGDAHHWNTPTSKQVNQQSLCTYRHQYAQNSQYLPLKYHQLLSNVSAASMLVYSSIST
jgi:hypothetical protein